MSNGPLVELLRRYKKLFIVEGIFFAVLGIFAIALPQCFSLTIDYFLAWLFIFSAIALAVRCYKTPEMPNRSSALLSTALYFTLGVLLLAYPASGILTLTLLLAFYFLFDGIAKIYGGLQIRPLKSWAWIVVSGAFSLVLATLILACWPSQASWMLGTLVGINLLITGITTIGFVLSV